MASPRADLEDHIATLVDFETRYSEFLLERRNRDHDWSDKEWARRERKLKELAPQAEVAMVAAGARRWDEGPVRIELPVRILRFVDEGDGIDDGDQWQILEELPTHIGTLKGELRRAPSVPDISVKDRDAERERRVAEAPSSRAPVPATSRPAGRSWWPEPKQLGAHHLQRRACGDSRVGHRTDPYRLTRLPPGRLPPAIYAATATLKDAPSSSAARSARKTSSWSRARSSSPGRTWV
jgi:hypothetical protein